jgi:hypothetical protein
LIVVARQPLTNRRRRQAELQVRVVHLAECRLGQSIEAVRATRDEISRRVKALLADL